MGAGAAKRIQDMKRWMTALAAAMLIWTAAAPARAESGVYADYTALRETLDTLMTERSVAALLEAFGGADEYTAEQLAALEVQMKNVYAEDFENKAMVRVVELENGFRQEMIAFWTGIDYVYVYLFLHQREADILAVHMSFNSDVNTIMEKF